MEQLEKFPKEEDAKYSEIVGAIAMPSPKRKAGFAVVIGKNRADSKFVVLDEIEQWDGRELVRSVGGLDYRYGLKPWVGDTNDNNLIEFVDELNKEFSGIDELKKKNPRRLLNIDPAGVLLMRDQESPYMTISSKLNQLLGGRERDPKKQRLIINPNSKLMGYLKLPQTEESATLQFGSLPALDALSFAVYCLLDMEAERKRGPRQEFSESDYQVL